MPDLISMHAEERPNSIALQDTEKSLTYSNLNQQMDLVAAQLQAEGLTIGHTIAICGLNSISYAVVFLGALRAGLIPALIAPSSTPGSIADMVFNSKAKKLFIDGSLSIDVYEKLDGKIPSILLEEQSFKEWCSAAQTPPEKVEIKPDWPFNIIYSSGTTGTPKGIVQSHRMRSEHIARSGIIFNYNPSSTTMIATPLYSNTTLVSFIPAIALGGTVVFVGKFDAETYLRLAEQYKATHGMLVPVQYKRIMALPNFDAFNLESFQVKFSTSAPFSADLKKDIVSRWPGGLIEFYGMTEGGGSCVLVAHQFLDKLHTVGQPAEGHDIRLIDDEGEEVPVGKTGEIVGSSNAMMDGYLGLPDKTRETEWYDATGKRFIRTGDIGLFDEDGFLSIVDRKKDMIISGGFNIYPSDLENILIEHDKVGDVSVVGVPSEDWGETPVAYAVLKDGMAIDKETLKTWFAGRVGKTQRLSDIIFVKELPRSAIGKVLKRDLVEAYIKR